MSVTTTANPMSTTVLQALSDYELHHSGDSEESRTPEPPNPDTRSSQSVQNPENWDNDHRRVPPYRPISRENYGPERPGGGNALESAFIFVMLNGTGLVSVIDRAWRRTGGKVNDTFFRHKIGGEW